MAHPLDEREETLNRVFELALLIGDDARAGLAHEGLTASRAHLLLVVAERGPSSQRALSDILRVTPRTVTALVDGLESTGFVTRERDESDRRVARVTLTKRGEACSRRLLTGRRQLAQVLLGDLRPRELRGFDSGVRHVIARLRDSLHGEDAAA